MSNRVPSFDGQQISKGKRRKNGKQDGELTINSQISDIELDNIDELEKVICSNLDCSDVNISINP